MKRNETWLGINKVTMTKTIRVMLQFMLHQIISSKKIAFPGERAYHPTDHNREENKNKLKKNKRYYRQMKKDLRNCLAYLGMRCWLRPWQQVVSNNMMDDKKRNRSIAIELRITISPC